MKTIFIILFIMFFVGCLDNQENYYANKDAVIEDNAIERGWIPIIIPDSAYEIEEKHNLDTNILKGSFKYNKKDESYFLNKLIDLNGKLIWKDFEFIINKKNNKVEFRNRI